LRIWFVILRTQEHKNKNKDSRIRIRIPVFSKGNKWMYISNKVKVFWCSGVLRNMVINRFVSYHIWI
jgi:hypothetical protein